MKKLVLAFKLLFFVRIACSANDTTSCKCQYPSAYDLKMYKMKADSILKGFNGKGSVVSIGYRSFYVSNILVIISKQGKEDAYFYDLAANRVKKVAGKNIEEIKGQILLNTEKIKSADKIPGEDISHDFSFFVSFGTGGKIYQICYSQVLSLKDRPVGRLFIRYMESFKTI